MSNSFLILIGFIFIFLGGDGLVRGCVTIAEKLNISPLLISSIIIGFGVSTPELFVSIDAAIQGFPDISLGNVIGSNISNNLLVLGTASMIAVIPCQTKDVRRIAITGVIASSFVAILSFSEYINRLTGLAMFIFLIAYTSYGILLEHKKTKRMKEDRQKIEVITKIKLPLRAAIITVFTSLALLLIGSRMLVTGAASLADQLGIAKSIIGLTLISIGTSLPEIVTSWIASWRKHPGMVIGSILGGNLYDIFWVLGITAFIRPIPFAGRLATTDVWIMLATWLLLFVFIISGKGIDRREGAALVISYILYINWIYLSQ